MNCLLKQHTEPSNATRNCWNRSNFCTSWATGKFQGMPKQSLYWIRPTRISEQARIMRIRRIYFASILMRHHALDEKETVWHAFYLRWRSGHARMRTLAHEFILLFPKNRKIIAQNFLFKLRRYVFGNTLHERSYKQTATLNKTKKCALAQKLPF